MVERKMVEEYRHFVRGDLWFES